ncbi:ATP-binding cassette domain-containing protein [Candidatus Bathyarchaeota archaeon]|nr:ATP-binding cassette domain-containing protein [Candidatus Bathyarchaeota archaeon]NIV44661.1 ATP-binding cassette domain-containing protein [Candidatus Bathyarchaeota archaeon]
MTGYHMTQALKREEDEEHVRKVPDRVLIARLAKYMLRHRGRLAIAVAAVLVASLSGLVPPYLLKVAIDSYIAEGDLTGLTFIAMILVVVYVINWFSGYQRTYQISWLGQNMVNDIRMKLFSHLQDLSFSFYDRSEAGRIISRVTNDTDTLSMIFVQGIVTVLSDILTLVGIVVVMLWLSIPLTLATLVVLPLLLLTTLVFQSRLRRAYRMTRKKIAKVTSKLQESISGIREIQSFTREKDNMEMFRRANVENLQANVQAGRIFAMLMPVIQIIGAVGTCVVLWYGGILTVGGGITLGILVAFLAYVTSFFRPIVNLTTFYNTIQSAMAAAERIFETIDTEPQIIDAPDAVELPRVEGSIAFQNVTFGYHPTDPVLKKIAFSVESGRTLAIVGPTGAGKSSIVRLLSRFYEPQAGTISIDGHDIRNVTLTSLHNQMGVVLQEPFLFSGTIMENIRYGKLNATTEEIKNIATLVGAHEFISGLADGYETEVGERGMRLSVGQRQLISFARALLRDPPILILDEATSSLDPYTELKIKKGLTVLLKDRTSLVIAHRLSTVRQADNIIVVNDGQIVEEGTHKKLMRRKGLYHRLYDKQFKDI